MARNALMLTSKTRLTYINIVVYFIPRQKCFTTRTSWKWEPLPNSTRALPSTRSTCDSAGRFWRSCGERCASGMWCSRRLDETGKTSVMDYLRDHPEDGFSVVSINVQDLTHPADFFQVLLDEFHDAHPDFVRDQLAADVDPVVDAMIVGSAPPAPDCSTSIRGSGSTMRTFPCLRSPKRSMLPMPCWDKSA